MRMKTNTKRDRLIAVACIIYGSVAICFFEPSFTWKIISLFVGLFAVIGVLYDLGSSRNEWFYGELMDVFQKPQNESERKFESKCSEGLSASVKYRRLAVRIVTFILILYIPLRSIHLDYMYTIEHGSNPPFLYNLILPVGIADGIMYWTWLAEWKAKKLRD